jgi:hypothetical protein
MYAITQEQIIAIQLSHCMLLFMNAITGSLNDKPKLFVHSGGGQQTSSHLV